MKRLLLSSIVLSLFFLNACAPKLAKPTVYREATLGKLLELIQRRENRIKTIKASLRMGFSRRESTRIEETQIVANKKGSFRHCLGVLVFEKPDKFRMKGYPQIGPTLFEVVSDGKYLWMYIPKEGKVYLSQDLKKGAAKADFNLQDLRSTFSVAEILNQPDINKFLEKREKEYILYLAKERLLEKVWIERSDFLTTKIERFNKDGSLALEVSFEKYQKINGINFPEKVRIYNPKEKRILTLLIQKVRLNEAIKPAVFQFEVPKGIEVIDLGRKD